MEARSLGNYSRSAMVIAHPSHELRLHGWLQMARPRVFVITDGSGRAGQPRLQSTTKVLTDAGASQGSIYGRFTDLEIYAAFLNHNFDLFISVAHELAEEFNRHEIEYVVSDSAEGYNSTHDACRLLTDAAVEIVNRRSKRQIAKFDYAVVDHPEECPAAIRNEAVWLFLDDEAFARKVNAARGYNVKLAADIEAALAGEPFQGVKRFSEPQLGGDVDKRLSEELVIALQSRPELKAKVKGVVEVVDLNCFRVECLRPVQTGNSHEPHETPFYELYGDKMVAAGHYKTTIRYEEHFLPVVEAVRRFVESQ